MPLGKWPPTERPAVVSAVCAGFLPSAPQIMLPLEVLPPTRSVRHFCYTDGLSRKIWSGPVLVWSVISAKNRRCGGGAFREEGGVEKALFMKRAEWREGFS